MKYAAAVAAMLAVLALPALAQHGGAHGGFGGHAASGGFGGHAASGGFASHGGFAPRGGGGFAPHGGGGFAPHSGGFAPRGYAPRFGGFTPHYGGVAPRAGGFAPQRFMGTGRTGFTPRFGSGMNGGMNRGIYRAPYPGNRNNRSGGRYGGDRGRHHRDRYRGGLNGLNGFNGYPYGYGNGGYPYYPIDLDPWLLGPDWLDSGDAGDDSGQSANGQYVPAPYTNYGEPAPGPGPYAGNEPSAYPNDAPDYAPTGYADSPAVSYRRPYVPTGDSVAIPQPGVTVIFKDGRAPEKIHNYLLTASTLTVLDAPYRQIPLDQIDLAATVAANRAEGLSFRVPGAIARSSN